MRRHFARFARLANIAFSVEHTISATFTKCRRLSPHHYFIARCRRDDMRARGQLTLLAAHYLS